MKCDLVDLYGWCLFTCNDMEYLYVNNLDTCEHNVIYVNSIDYIIPINNKHPPNIITMVIYRRSDVTAAQYLHIHVMW